MLSHRRFGESNHELYLPRGTFSLRSLRFTGDNIDANLSGSMGGHIGTYPEFNGTVMEKTDV